ncbi:MAG: VWA domain-containing protein [Acidobacteria bacterium]|nr:VWA domain-containing protein [Acidobacteriota bacterium]
MDEKIKDILGQQLKGVPPSRIESLSGKLGGLPAERALLMLDIGIGLAGSSLRAALEFLWQGPEAARYLETEELRLWGRIGRQLVSVNTDAAVNFFQTSISVLEGLPSQLRGLALALCDRQALISSGVAMDCFMVAPKLVKGIADEQIARRIYEVAYEISRRSATQSAELLTAAPRILSFLRQEHRGPIKKPGVSQTDRGTDTSSPPQNRLIDEVLTLTAVFAHRAGGLATEFFSTLPQTLPETHIKFQLCLLENTRAFLERGGGAALQYFSVAGQILVQTGPRTLERWTGLAQKIAAQGNAAVYNFLKLTPRIMTQLALLGRRQADALSCDVLSLVDEVADHNVFLAIECFKSSAAALQAGSFEQFARWARAGLQLHQRDVRHAHAYYALETKTSQQSLKDITGGLALNKVMHTLRLYMEGLAGQELSVKPLSAFNLSHLPDEMRLGDGKAIHLPSLISEFEDEPSNFRLYKALAAHAAGQIEFGTYATDTPELRSVLERVQADFVTVESQGIEPKSQSGPVTFVTVISHFPHLEFVARLFTVLENGRIDSRLRQTYRGIRRDLDFFQDRLREQRPQIEMLTPDQAIVELLFQMTLCGRASEPICAALSSVIPPLESIIEEHIQRPDAGVADTLTALHQIYRLLVNSSNQPAQAQSRSQTPEQHEGQVEPESTSDLESTLDEQGVAEFLEKASRSESEPLDQWMQATARRIPSDADSSQATGRDHPNDVGLDPEDRAYYYDEWDRELSDYRAGWCRVIEKSARRGGRQFVEYVRSYYGPIISSVKYQFQLLRPEALKKIRGEVDGEDFDLQAVIDYALDRRASGRISERLYVRHLRKQRDVAVSFLLDMSSSTARTVAPGSGGRSRAAKRIIDIEKEGLVLMSEALEAVGDLYSIQGFTSEGRHHVKFYVVKDFEEPYGPEVESRIGGITYQNNTRLGAAIRHAAARLLQQTAQTKLLIVLSDGRPYDHDYGDSRYAREDTKVALRQTRMEGVIPFCITIDRESEVQLRDMYGEVGYTIIDDVLSLPERLPGIYRRLTE